MTYIQAITPNPNIPCEPGWCLTYVQGTFGIGAKYPTAISAWNASRYKHQDQSFPAGLWVPIWFTMKGEPAGHVALRAPDGSIWSTSHPTANAPYHHPTLAHLMSYYGGRLGYLGWTEDVEDTLVIKGGEDMTTIGSGDNWRWRMNRLHHQLVRNGDMSDEVFRSIQGGDAWGVVESWSDHPEANLLIHWQEVGEVAERDNWPGQIYGLQDQVKALTSQLGADSAAKKQAVELQAQIDALTKSVEAATAERDKLRNQADEDKAVADTWLRRLGQWISNYLPGSK